jgi:hypothetical protein
MSFSSPASEKKSVRGILGTVDRISSSEEEIVFRHKCRVFAMRDNKWVELGTGDAKVSNILLAVSTKGDGGGEEIEN